MTLFDMKGKVAVITGSTRMKAGTATKLALNMLSTSLMVKLGKTYGNLMVDMHASNAKLVERALRLTVQATGADPERARAMLERWGGWRYQTLADRVRDL